ncbi:hypothetical protein SAMN05443549_10162 [Flavobacterium fluvii]|uniref:Uncharacterized protein n=1 Tax=Flavobacterium fluvii TaxID=468056 RepID=A0A1M5DST5_9FLAO|nr:hypothetical protein [Flavobacterium fluvii]SHF70098.1 hypothetical protein SAMN05443549_10162 [Flavobacterium fluvii]
MGLVNFKDSVNPVLDASNEEFKKWIEIMENRCWVNDNLFSLNPISWNL